MHNCARIFMFVIPVVRVLCFLYRVFARCIMSFVPIEKKKKIEILLYRCAMDAWTKKNKTKRNCVESVCSKVLNHHRY